MTGQMIMQEFYQIRVKGHFSPQLAGWFDDLTVTNEPDGAALLSGFIIDQAALYGVLLKIHHLGLTLLSVNRVEPHSDDASQAQYEEK
jgi:hypothetical protein